MAIRFLVNYNISHPGITDTSSQNNFREHAASREHPFDRNEWAGVSLVYKYIRYLRAGSRG